MRSQSLLQIIVFFLNLFIIGHSLPILTPDAVINRSQKAPIDYTQKPIIGVLGGPGAGKSTQCKKIVAKYGLTHISIGELLRAEANNSSDRAKTLAAIISAGEWAPADVVIELVKEAMEAKANTSNGFLMDTYRSEFEKAIGPATVILYFETSIETLTERLLGRAVSSGRADDNEETIKRRLKIFHEHNDKVLAQNPNKIVRLNAEKSEEEIFADVQKTLDRFLVVRSEVEN